MIFFFSWTVFLGKLSICMTLSHCVLSNLVFQVNTCLKCEGSFSNEGDGGKNWPLATAPLGGSGDESCGSETQRHVSILCESLPHAVHVRWISDQEKADWYSQPCLAAESVITGFWLRAKEKQKNKWPEGDCVSRSVIAGPLIDRWSLSLLLSSWMQRSAVSESERRVAVDKWVIG